MTKPQIDTLRDLAVGSPTTNYDRTDMFGQKFIDKSEQWLTQNKNLSPEVRLEEWKLKNSDWSFTPNNKQYYWEKVEELAPHPKEHTRQTVLDDITTTLNSFKSLEEKESYFRDKAHTFPEYANKNLEEYFFNLRSINDRKNIEKARISQVMEMDRMLVNTHLNLNPDVSLESHTSEFLKAYDSGFSNIRTNEEGRITVPIDGVDTPVFSLPDPVLSLEEEFISLNDLTSRVRLSLKPRLELKRMEVLKSEKLANQALLNRVEDDSIPDEFKSNIIIDGIMDDPDPVLKTRNTINSLVRNKIQKGVFEKHGEVSRYVYSLYRDIFNKLERRINDGANSG